MTALDASAKWCLTQGCCTDNVHREAYSPSLQIQHIVSYTLPVYTGSTFTRCHTLTIVHRAYIHKASSNHLYTYQAQPRQREVHEEGSYVKVKIVRSSDLVQHQGVGLLDWEDPRPGLPMKVEHEERHFSAVYRTR